MAADGQVDLQRPVGLHPVEIEHIQTIGHGQAAGFANLVGQLAQDCLTQGLVPTTAEDIHRRGMQPIARQQAATQAELQKPLFLQCLHQAMGAGLGNVQLFSQSTGRQRLRCASHGFDDFQHTGDGRAFFAGSAAHRLPCCSKEWTAMARDGCIDACGLNTLVG